MSIVLFCLEPGTLFFLVFRYLVSKMSQTIISSSSDSTEKAIDEYYDITSNGSSSDSSHSSGESSMDERYTFGLSGLPLEVIQEQIRKAFGSKVGTSSNVPPSSPMDEKEIVYSCAVGVHSKTNEQRLSNLRAWY